MKTTIATLPAFTVVSLNAEVITVRPEDCIFSSTVRFCVNKVSKRHGDLYPEVSLNCVAYYAASYKEDVEAAVARAVANKHELYWVNGSGASITSHKRDTYELILLKPGQLISMNSVLLRFEQTAPNSEHYKLTRVFAD